MARSNEAISRFSELLRQAEAMSETLRFDELPGALGSAERLRALLWTRLYAGAATAPARIADEFRTGLEEIIRALRTATRSPEPAKPQTTGRLLTVPQAAELLALRESTIRSWLLHRRLPAVRVGRAVRIKETDVRKLIESGYVPARADR